MLRTKSEGSIWASGPLGPANSTSVSPGKDAGGTRAGSMLSPGIGTEALKWLTKALRSAVAIVVGLMS